MDIQTDAAPTEQVELEVRAGKMSLFCQVLTADRRPGMVRLTRSDDGLLHFRWHCRNGAEVAPEAEDSTVVFPDEAKLKKVERPGSSVLLLDFDDSTRANWFFWLQESMSDIDTYIQRMNEIISTSMDGVEGPVEEEVEDVDSRVALSAPEPAPALPAAAASAPSAASLLAPAAVGGRVDASALASILSGMGLPQASGGSAVDPASAAAALAAAFQQPRRIDMGPSLADVLKPEVIVPLLRSPDMVERLAPYLPESHRNMEAMVALAQSSQFRQQLETFGQALQSGYLNLAHFGLQAEGFSVADFLKGIQAQVEREQQGQGSEVNPNGDGSTGPAPMEG